MGFLDFLSGASEIGTAKGFDINKKDFEIQDADKLFGQTQDQYKLASQQAQNLQGKSDAFLNTLEQQASGKGPSLAVESMKQNQERNLAQQLASAQAQRGGNPALTQKNLLQAQQAGNQNVAQGGAMARIQEQNNAQQLYGGQLQNQQNMVNQMTQQYLQQGMNLRQAQEAAMADYNHLQVQQTLGIEQINSQNQQARGGMTGKLVGGLISAGAAAASGGATAAPGQLQQPGQQSQAQSYFNGPNPYSSSASSGQVPSYLSGVQSQPTSYLGGGMGGSPQYVPPAPAASGGGSGAYQGYSGFSSGYMPQGTGNR